MRLLVNPVWLRWFKVISLSIVMLMLTTGYDWPQFGKDPQHSSNDTQETNLKPGNVATLRLLYRVQLPDTADGAPVYVDSVSTISGTINLILATTKSGHLVALNALTGAPVWVKQNPPGSCRINNGSAVCYTTSSPVVDPNRQVVYSYGLDGYVHKYALSNGAEVSGNGWPETATLKAYDEKGSSALTLATAQNGASYLYVANGGYPGDNGNYQGHITAIDLSDGRQQVFNTLCSDQAVHFTATTPDCTQVQSGVWSRAGVVYDAMNDRIFLVTGNATFDPTQHHWGDTVMALNPDGTGAAGDPLDTYTPVNYASLQNYDTDLGSTNIAILPVPLTSTVPHVGVQGGKDALLRLLNMDRLSQQTGTGHTGGEVGTPISVPQGGEILTAPAVWVNPIDSSTWVFVVNGSGLSGLQVTFTSHMTPTLTSRWSHTGNGGTSPIVANNMLFYAGNNHLWALNPTNGNVLWQDTSIGSIHWQSPIVANGVLYIEDQSGYLTAYTVIRVYLPILIR